jgi:hypothetical protein
MARKKKKLPYEAKRHLNLTGVGFIFDMSATEIAGVLRQFGLREDQKPTNLALKNRFVKEYTTDKSHLRLPWDNWKLQNDRKYWQWSTDRISLLLLKEGMVPKSQKYATYLENIMSHYADPHTLKAVENVLESIPERNTSNV